MLKAFILLAFPASRRGGLGVPASVRLRGFPHTHQSQLLPRADMSPLPGIVAGRGTTSTAPRLLPGLGHCVSSEAVLGNLTSLVSKLRFLLWNGNRDEVESGGDC